MDILITGGEGQLGRELQKSLSSKHHSYSLGKGDLDITNKEKADLIINQLKPDIIIHAAAYTAVDKCESERKKAFEVNSLGAGYIASAGKKVNARIIYISTDYVFDGKKQSPYTEDDIPNPLSVYGMSKWLGERIVLTNSDATVIRTSWLYGHEGKNFVKTMLELGKENREIKVVNDQIGSPTYVNDLAAVIEQLIDKENSIYHFSNTGSCTWFTFAKRIFEEAGYDPARVQPITSAEYGVPAPRPAYSVMEHKAINNQGIKTPRHWEYALKDFIRKELSK
ncbi:dTDP-4-dehydrorhamnose reductase [Bacillus sp. NTK034]|nr:dTDP-4-dehydrorhamnose reductase [Bacillus sp. NTK034]